MKKLLTLTAILAFATPAMAGFQNSNSSNGGYTQSQKQSSSITSVAQAKKARDNARFSITGYIVSQIDDDEFIFRDTAGNRIKIDVDDNAWRGQNVTPKNKIRIRGKVDRDDGEVTLDVYRIQKL